MNANKLFSEFSFKKIWDKLIQHDKAMNSTLLVLSSGKWEEQEDSTFKNTVSYSSFKETDKLTVDLYDDGTITENALSEYEVYIDEFEIINGALVATANTKPTQTMTIVVKGDFESSEATVSRELLEDCFQSVSDGKALIASAITDKKVPTDATATFAEMAEHIAGLKLGSGTAQKDHVLAPYTFTNADGVEYTGTMTNNGAKTASLNCGGSYTIPAGYHNGSGKVTANSLASQTSATAAAAQITKGYTAWVNGVKVIGTRPAITTTLTGTDKIYIYERYGTYYKIIKFSKQFDSPPKVTVAAGNPSSDTISFDNVTEGSFRAIAKNVNGVTGNTDAFTWTATGVTSS